jgi:hypothetical protein
MKKILLALAFLTTLHTSFVYSQVADTTTKTISIAPKKKWSDIISLRGYTQMRYNRLLETNDQLKCDQCDKSLGENGGFFFRRARLVLSGNIHERFYIYIQTDLATNAQGGSATGLNYLQLRDLYGDLYLIKDKTLRLRLGLSKVPFGFDVLQSSQNRAAFDRSDAINSAAYNERDMGAFLYFTPKKIQERFKKLQNAQLKGTGDYGVLGIGIYNGQTINRLEGNNELHVAARATYPFALRSQVVEVSAQAYSGRYNVGELMSAGVTTPNPDHNVVDRRVGASLIVYPKPIGFQAEYNWGEGPSFTEDAPGVYSIRKRALEGGYVQLMGAIPVKKTQMRPYIRYQYYKGGKKLETDARFHVVKETEIGLEWQPAAFLEINTAYMISDRVFEDSQQPSNHQYGNMLRIQLQFNY